MQFLEGILLAFQALWANKLRSILTLVGTIIGVATVIAVVSVINGMNKYVGVKINSIGSNTFIIEKEGIITSDEDWLRVMKRKNITVGDMKAIEKYCSLCSSVGASSYTQGKVKFESEFLEDVDIIGATYNFLEVSDVELDYGRNLDETDEEHHSAVCIVGPDVVANLIKSGSPLGKDIKVRNHYFRIVGVGKSRGTFLGNNEDNWVAVPLNSFEKYFGRRRSISIYAKAADINVLEDAQDQARMILRSRRGVKYNEPDDFGMFTAGSLMELYNSFTSGAWIVLTVISSISLLVGGIVIMNIMLVSVTERTREIGIRKAIGARHKDILWQFLVEAVTQSLVGGILGVIFGVVLAFLISKFSPLPASIELWAIFSGLGVACSIGIIFGLFPALKAARLDPIESLRYE